MTCAPTYVLDRVFFGLHVLAATEVSRRHRIALDGDVLHSVTVHAKEPRSLRLYSLAEHKRFLKEELM